MRVTSDQNTILLYWAWSNYLLHLSLPHSTFVIERVEWKITQTPQLRRKQESGLRCKSWTRLVRSWFVDGHIISCDKFESTIRRNDRVPTGIMHIRYCVHFADMETFASFPTAVDINPISGIPTLIRSTTTVHRQWNSSDFRRTRGPWNVATTDCGHQTPWPNGPEQFIRDHVSPIWGSSLFFVLVDPCRLGICYVKSNERFVHLGRWIFGSHIVTRIRKENQAISLCNLEISSPKLLRSRVR